MVFIVDVNDLSTGTVNTREFTKSPVRIGRNHLNEISIQDPFISEYHGVFRFDAAGMSFTDLGSTNGTVFQGERLAKNSPLPLADDARLLLGRIELRVRRGDARPAGVAAALQPTAFGPTAIAGELNPGAPRMPAADPHTLDPPGMPARPAPMVTMASPPSMPAAPAPPPAAPGLPDFGVPAFDPSAVSFGAPAAPPQVPSNLPSFLPLSAAPPVPTIQPPSAPPPPLSFAPPPALAAPGLPSSPAPSPFAAPAPPPLVMAPMAPVPPPPAAPAAGPAAAPQAFPSFGSTGAIPRIPIPPPPAAGSPYPSLVQPNALAAMPGLTPNAPPPPAAGFGVAPPAMVPPPAAASPIVPLPLPPLAPMPAPAPPAAMPQAAPLPPAPVIAPHAPMAPAAGPDPRAAKLERALEAMGDALVELRRSVEEAGIDLGVRPLAGTSTLHHARDGREIAQYLTGGADLDNRLAQLRSLFREIGEHQGAMKRATAQSVHALLESLDPRAHDLEGGPRLFNVGKSRSQWRDYVERFTELVDDSDALERELFGDAFAEAYGSGGGEDDR